MIWSSSVRRLLPALAFLVIAATPAFAQSSTFARGVLSYGDGQQAPAPAQEEFVPQVGQAGKDVVWVPTPPELVEAMLDLA